MFLKKRLFSDWNSKTAFLFTTMDRNYIAQQAARLESKQDLLSLLNRIKMSWYEDLGMPDLFHPFTMRQLNYYSNPNHTFHRFRQFKIKKKTGGYRQITAPRNKTFKLILMCLNELFKSIYTPSDYAMGFTEGRSVVSNADIHRGQNYVFNIDLKDFFPSIFRARIRARLQAKPFSFGEDLAIIIAGLCSMKVSTGHNDGSDYVLPQGSPTSPIITNMICDNLDRRLAGLAKRFGLRYSRYADDITFSSMHYVYKKRGDFRKELLRIITQQGFTINDAKTRLQKRGSRQEVTGIIVNDKLNVSRKYVREIRSLLYIWEHHGYTTAMSVFWPKYKSEKGHVKKGKPELLNVLDGKLMYLKMVKGDDDIVYRRLHDKFQLLAQQLTDPAKTTSQDVTYLETWPIKEFETKLGTTIEFVMPQPGEESVQSENNQASHRYALFSLAGKKTAASINRSIKNDELEKKNLLSVSLCKDAVGVRFWLIHRSNKHIVPPPKLVDIDELNNELDLLLKM